MFSTIELIATILGFICTLFSLRQNILTWPFGAASVLLYAVLFFHSKLYADTTLQFIYFGLFLYGWWKWLYGGKNKSTLVVSHIKLRQAILLSIAAVLSSWLIATFLKTYTDSQLPYWDASLMILCLIAQWMMARKYLENWYLWFGTDAVYVGIYIYKKLYLTGLLYSVYTILAILGYLWWRQSMRQITTLISSSDETLAETS